MTASPFADLLSSDQPLPFFSHPRPTGHSCLSRDRYLNHSSQTTTVSAQHNRSPRSFPSCGPVFLASFARSRRLPFVLETSTRNPPPHFSFFLAGTITQPQKRIPWVCKSCLLRERPETPYETLLFLLTTSRPPGSGWYHYHSDSHSLHPTLFLIHPFPLSSNSSASSTMLPPPQIHPYITANSN